jgi:hypothetical protein
MTKTYYPFENGCGSDKLMVRDAMVGKAALHRRKMVQKSILSVAGKIINEEKHERYMTEIISSAEIVFGIWADRQHPDGCNSIIVKGEHLVVHMKPNTEAMYRVDALPCASLEHAQQIARAIQQYQISESHVTIKGGLK